MLVQMETNITETKEMFNELLTNPSKVFGLMRCDLRVVAERALSEMLKVELTQTNTTDL